MLPTEEDLDDPPAEEVCALCGALLDEFEVGTAMCDDCADAIEL